MWKPTVKPRREVQGWNRGVLRMIGSEKPSSIGMRVRSAGKVRPESTCIVEDRASLSGSLGGSAEAERSEEGIVKANRPGIESVVSDAAGGTVDSGSAAVAEKEPEKGAVEGADLGELELRMEGEGSGEKGRKRRGKEKRKKKELKMGEVEENEAGERTGKWEES